MPVALLVLAFAMVNPLPSAAQPAESSWPQYQHDARHTGRTEVVGPVTAARQRCRVELTGTRAGLPVTGADGTIYVASGGKDDEPSTWRLAAIDPNDCSETWTVALPGAPEVAAPAVSTTGTVYVYTDADGATSPARPPSPSIPPTTTSAGTGTSTPAMGPTWRSPATARSSSPVAARSRPPPSSRCSSPRPVPTV